MPKETYFNIEMKAILNDEHSYNSKCELAKYLIRDQENSNEPKMIFQRDVYFNTNKGRLILQYIENDTAKLIYYDGRSSSNGPTLSKYDVLEVQEPEIFEEVLTDAMGVLGTQEKTRLLYKLDNKRIYLDVMRDKDELPIYGIEVEIPLKSQNDSDKGRNIANFLIERLNINKGDIRGDAYFDLII